MNIINKILSSPLMQSAIKRYIQTTVHSTKYALYSNFIKFNKVNSSKQFFCNVFYSASLLTWLGFKEDVDKESELIMALKRSVLCMQRKEYVKAEQMLHLALRIAQEQGNADGVTYAYDLMANLALERSQFDKSEKLFVNLLQRLLSTGTSEEDLKVIHISLKLARICQFKKEFEKAEIGYQWCLDTVKKHKNDENALILNGVILDWYGNYLSETGNYKKSLQHLEEAYNIYSKLEGTNTEKSVLLLNDLGTVNSQSGNYEIANEYLTKALDIGRTLNDFEDIGIIYANIGLVKIKLGLLNEAKKFCKEGWRISNKSNNAEALKQANYCFEQIHAQT